MIQLKISAILQTLSTLVHCLWFYCSQLIERQMRSVFLTLILISLMKKVKLSLLRKMSTIEV